MTNYIPFLKTKQNEFSCLKALSPEIAENIIPFFDIQNIEKLKCILKMSTKR